MRLLAAIAFSCLATVNAYAYGPGGPDARYVPGVGYVNPGPSAGSFGTFRSLERKKEVSRKKRTAKKLARRVGKRARFSLAGFPAPLVAKVRELERKCGSVITSAHRPGARVRGSGRLSLHHSREAVDMNGNPRCMRVHLRGWPGGLSTDYHRVKHYHISYSFRGREWGSRFVHWQPTRAARRRGYGG